MKKIFSFLLLIHILTGLYAQHAVRLGVNMDPIITWLSPKNDNLERDGMRLGITGGLMVEAYFHDNYAFASGISLGLQGGNLIYEDSVTIITENDDPVILTPGTSVAYKLSYITIPVSVKMKTNEIGYFTYFAQLGFVPQLNVGSRANSVGKRLEKDFVGKEINLLKLSYFIGGGIEYGLGGQTALVIGFFYNSGFIDVLSNNDYKAINSFLTFRLGVIF